MSNLTFKYINLKMATSEDRFTNKFYLKFCVNTNSKIKFY